MIQSLAMFGKFVIYGFNDMSGYNINGYDLFQRNFTVTGFQSTVDAFDLKEGVPAAKRMISEILNYIAQGYIKLPVEKEFPLEDLYQAYEYQANGPGSR